MRTKILSFLLTALSLISITTRANDIEPGKEFYTVVYRPNPIVLDGNLSEWAGVPVLADPKFAIPKGSGAAGTYVLFAVLCGAASYIAVPAVQRMAIPEASPTLPLAASLGLTFSYNVTIGIPVYILITKLITTTMPVAASAAVALVQ